MRILTGVFTALILIAAVAAIVGSEMIGHEIRIDQATAQKAVDGIAGIELNLACPNVPGKPVIAYDFEQMEAVLEVGRSVGCDGGRAGGQLTTFVGIGIR